MRRMASTNWSGRCACHQSASSAPQHRLVGSLSFVEALDMADFDYEIWGGLLRAARGAEGTAQGVDHTDDERGWPARGLHARAGFRTGHGRQVALGLQIRHVPAIQGQHPIEPDRM